MAKYEIWSYKDKTQAITPEIFFRITYEEFLLTDDKWIAYKKLHCPDPPPAHHDWRWQDKAATNQPNAFVALKYAGEIEGMMMISLTPRPCLLPGAKHKNLLYIEYLETAPWNQKVYAQSAVRFLAVGTCLIDVAIDLSVKHGCEGRLGLLSLDDVKSFYVKQGFQNLGEDPFEKLDYFELSDKVLGNAE